MKSDLSPNPLSIPTDGLGNLTNSLSLGCDCLGEIRYLDAINVSHDGKAAVIKNAICIHEEDDGKSQALINFNHI